MFLARVTGMVTASVVVDGLEGVKLLYVQPEKSDGTLMGKSLIACDGTGQAGAGQLVYIVDGREAVLPLPEEFVPSDATIVGIVDRVDVSGGNT